MGEVPCNPQGDSDSLEGFGEVVLEGNTHKFTWKRGFKLPWREAGPPNHLDDEVVSMIKWIWTSVSVSLSHALSLSAVKTLLGKDQRRPVCPCLSRGVPRRGYNLPLGGGVNKEHSLWFRKGCRVREKKEHVVRF
jgi:hypothetical protein